MQDSHMYGKLANMWKDVFMAYFELFTRDYD
jgi:hypothetical protein